MEDEEFALLDLNVVETHAFAWSYNLEQKWWNMLPRNYD